MPLAFIFPSFCYLKNTRVVVEGQEDRGFVSWVFADLWRDAEKLAAVCLAALGVIVILHGVISILSGVRYLLSVL